MAHIMCGKIRSVQIRVHVVPHFVTLYEYLYQIFLSCVANEFTKYEYDQVKREQRNLDVW
jgi:hypothetical protein